MGSHRFDEIRRDCGMATNILTDRLKLMVGDDLLQRRRYQTKPDRYEYVLTPKGMDLYPIIVTLMSWGDRWLASPAGPPLVLHHLPCESRLEPVVVCDRCEQAPDPHQVSLDGFAGQVAGPLSRLSAGFGDGESAIDDNGLAGDVGTGG